MTPEQLAEAQREIEYHRKLSVLLARRAKLEQEIAELRNEVTVRQHAETAKIT